MCYCNVKSQHVVSGYHESKSKRFQKTQTNTRLIAASKLVKTKNPKGQSCDGGSGQTC